MASKAEEKIKVQYEPDIITCPETYEKPFDMSKVPVFTLENCEILNTSITSQSPKYGHNIQILLPVDSNFNLVDKQIRAKFLANAQVNNPNLELVKASVSIISKKDVLDGKAEERNLNRAYVDIKVSNSYMFDRTIGADGKTEDKKISKMEEAVGSVVVKYFRVIDKFSGEGVEPDIFKYVNGEKVKSFISPKTKQETPLYLSRGDIVNIKIRPYATVNSKTGDITLKYNLLSVEVVQTAWDRGIGRKSSSKRVHEAPEAIEESALSDIFGGISLTSTPTATPKAQPTQTVSQAHVQPVAQTQQVVQPQVVTQQQEVQQQPTGTVDMIDFSALSNLDMSNLNLGE